ncbi:helix-turn-helix domain-containing protein [Sphingomonas arantia]|uniref:Helix-turn-helix domain-containing protein n=2 Tax=Sphingomonas arantia TaxID=1460676 RepID=A0ABW4U1X2_9SPHN
MLAATSPVVNETLDGETQLTPVWEHGDVHSSFTAMKGHVVTTYHGGERAITLRTGSSRHEGRARPGAISLIPSGHAGRWDMTGPLRVSHVFLGEDRLQHCAEALHAGKTVELLDRAGFDDPVGAGIMQMLSAEAVSLAQPSRRLFAEQAVDLLCTQLIRSHSSSSPVVPARALRGLADWQVKRVKDYMREHLDQPISLDDLAGLVRLSRFHFCTAFRTATGRTPHDWLVGQRIARARELLGDRDRPVTDIALSVGYETPSAFSACFRKLVGVTPSEFRRRHALELQDL